jgi:hypothetical protein
VRTGLAGTREFDKRLGQIEREHKKWPADLRNDMEILNSPLRLAGWGVVGIEFRIPLLAVDFEAHAIVSIKLMRIIRLPLFACFMSQYVHRPIRFGIPA